MPEPYGGAGGGLPYPAQPPQIGFGVSLLKTRLLDMEDKENSIKFLKHNICCHKISFLFKAPAPNPGYPAPAGPGYPAPGPSYPTQGYPGQGPPPTGPSYGPPGGGYPAQPPPQVNKFIFTPFIFK